MVLFENKIPTQDEAKKLLRYWKERFQLDLMRGRITRANTYIVCRLILSAGCRISEVCKLRVGHCHLKEKTPYLEIYGKRDARRGVAISKKMAKELRDYISLRKALDANIGDNNFLLASKSGPKSGPKAKTRPMRTTQSIRHIWKKACEAVGFYYRPHAGRHYYALSLLHSSQSLPFVKSQLGHKSIRTTSTYL